MGLPQFHGSSDKARNVAHLSLLKEEARFPPYHALLSTLFPPADSHIAQTEAAQSQWPPAVGSASLLCSGHPRIQFTKERSCPLLSPSDSWNRAWDTHMERRLASSGSREAPLALPRIAFRSCCPSFAPRKNVMTVPISRMLMHDTRLDLRNNKLILPNYNWLWDLASNRGTPQPLHLPPRPLACPSHPSYCLIHQYSWGRGCKSMNRSL